MDINTNINFKTALKRIPTKGNLAYEYNPFRNYRLDLDKWFYKNEFYTNEELAKELGYSDKETNGETVSAWDLLTNEIGKTDPNWYKVIPKYETKPVLYQKGQLVDFITDELDLDLEHPINILPTYSYDNSVDLIINDGINEPKIINSRFSATERNKYEIIDRNGDSDTNIYDLGFKFKSQTSLYKGTSYVSNFELLNVGNGGDLKIGLYSLYFAYIDDDGNESDIFAESGPIQIFIGNNTYSINSGFRDLKAYKTIKYQLTNLDPGYNRIQVYYSRATSDLELNPTVSVYKLLEPISYTTNICINTFTGFEQDIELSVNDINLRLQRYIAAETLAVCLNRLFLGHTYKVPLNYKDLKDIALRFLPVLSADKIYKPIDNNSYICNDLSQTYYDPKFTYNFTGYWNDIYRFGIVFILNDGTYSDVYNVRGYGNLGEDPKYSKIDFYVNNTEERNYISWDENNYHIITDTDKGASDTDKGASDTLENVKGVVKFTKRGLYNIIGIRFKVDDEVLTYLKDKLGIKGFFFVRLKRIPTILCLAYTIPIDNESNTPCIPYSGSEINTIPNPPITSAIILGLRASLNIPKFNIQNVAAYTEGFLERTTKSVVLSYTSRLITLDEKLIRNQGAICPEYDVNYPYYNSIFCGNELPIVAYDWLMENTEKPNSNVHTAIPSRNISLKEDEITTVSVIGVEDNTALVETGGYKFSARAGEAEEARKYKYAGKEIKSQNATNLLRGSYGPFLGIVGNDKSGLLIDLYIPGYSPANMEDYFKIRYADSEPYFTISKLYSLENFDLIFENGTTRTLRDTLYRGDCFICNYTHRLNRNFQDPSAPTNDAIVDPNTWKDNYKVEDEVVKPESWDKINLGDINAVKLGTYINLVVRANMNLNVRSLNDSIPDEVTLTGSPRTFVPNVLYTTDGEYKKPEALCYNKGLAKTTNERMYIALPDVPYYKEDFTNRIAYSDIKIKDSFANGFRVFKDGQYRDYPKTYGSIIKLIEVDGSLICVLEHGIYRIPVNERAVAGEGSGGPVYINTSNILPENPMVISDKYGSLWRDSVIKTPTGVYGFDTSAKKIWKFSGNLFEILSDKRILKFLNDNITLTERELTPILGVRNVKTHYNEFKGDVMFTFYDNLHGFEERAWSICWNERLNMWTTFYSWIPSYSENIQNQFYSFDRNVSKWIAKLGVSNHGNKFSDGVTLSNNIINTKDATKSEHFVGKLYLDKRELLKLIDDQNGTSFSYVTFSLERDNYGNYKRFGISPTLYGGDGENDIVECNLDEGKYLGLDKLLNCKEVYLKLYLNDDPVNLCSELYQRVYKDTNGKLIYPFNEDNWDGKAWLSFSSWIHSIKSGECWDIYKDDKGRRVWLDNEKLINGNKIVTLLNIKATIHLARYSGENSVDINEVLTSGYSNLEFVDAGYYESVVAVIPDYNILFLSADFWKHGRGGIIDIADEILPTYWYGKQHPFEFEFVVRNTPDSHKIFDNLILISNKAAPESFHYEIIGECYDFAQDKKNMYIRQEATKELYLFNGSDVVYNDDYKGLDSVHRKIKNSKNYERSTIFPAYYYRLDNINDIEDYYHNFNGEPDTKNFAALSGAEIVRYKDLDEYRIWNHAKAVDVNEGDVLRGNMQYKEDNWNILINPINIVLKNETDNDWVEKFGTDTTKHSVPVELNLFKDKSAIPPDKLQSSQDGYLELPEDWTKNVVSWGEFEKENKQIKMKDKFIKVRIRYSGKDLALIHAIKTLYSVSYA